MLISLMSLADAVAPAAPVLAEPVLAAVPSAATTSRVRPGTATWAGHGGPAILGDAPSRAFVKSVQFGIDNQAAGQAEFARQQRTSKKNAYPMTRIATPGGGALGSHPARDPV